MKPPIDRQFTLFSDLEVPVPETVSRFRLSLVEEETTPYDPAVSLAAPEAAAAWISEHIALRPQEHMVAAYLDTRQNLVGWTIAHVGTLNRAAAEPRTVLQIGLLIHAAGFILAHNHPSGDPTPSAEDIAFTRRIAEAGDIVGVRLIDHLVIGRNDRWVSLRRRGVW